jgi:hypothetical protein
MSVDELFAAYPDVTNAVGYVEMIFCDFDGMCPGQSTPWDELRKRKPDADPEWVARFLRRSAAEISPGETAADLAFIEKARRELEHPQFMVYLAGKMGAC